MDVDIYLRKSRLEEQSNEGQVFEEVVSGESLYARPQMLALLDKVANGKVDAVLCMDIDRLGRGNMRDQGIILDVFKESDTKIITPDHTYDLDDDSDEQLTEFKAFFARQEYKQIRKRLIRGKLQTIKQGAYVCNVPYGYRKVVINKIPTLEIDEEEAKFVRMIFGLYCDGIGCDRIAEILDAAGAKPRRSDSWARVTILKMIKNPLYIGKIVWNRTEWRRKAGKLNIIPLPKEKWLTVDGLHEPIISEEKFAKAQEILLNRYIPPTFDGSIKSPLAGLIRCGVCGRNMQRAPYGSRAKDKPYLRCLTKKCQQSVQYDFVEPRILKCLEDKLREKAISTVIKDEPVQYEAILNGIDSEILKSEKQKSSLHELLELRIYDVETYRERMKVVSNRLDELIKQRNEITLKISNQKQLPEDELKNKISNALDFYRTSDIPQRNNTLKSFIDHIDYYKAKGSKPAEFELVVFYK